MDEQTSGLGGHCTRNVEFRVVQSRFSEAVGAARLVYPRGQRPAVGAATAQAAAPTLSSEGLFKDPHVRDRGVFLQVEHPEIGKDWVIAPPWRFSETPAQIKRHAPLLGEHNEAVFGELLGMSSKEIKTLEQERVIY